MNNTAIFTIVSKNYIAYARTLLGSVKDLHPDVDLYLLLADEIDGKFEPKDEIFQVLEASQIGIPEFTKMSFMYDILEFNTAVKPFFMKFLIDKGYRKIIYFDPDIMLFRRLDPILDLLDRNSIVLTPHITRPIPQDGKLPSEREFLTAGTYNLGFIGIGNDENSRKMVQWWCDRLAESCFTEMETGLFVDQKWINLVPGMFGAVYIYKNRGCNMAYWNLHERSLADDLMVNQVEPLIFYHFSGINLNDLNPISKYQNRYTLKERSDLSSIFELYRDKLLSNNFQASRSWDYKYSQYDNGVVIGPLARRLYSTVAKQYPDPFEAGPGSYYELLKKKRMLEKVAATKTSQDRSAVIGKFNKLLKFAIKLLGPNRYADLMRYLRFISVVRRQDFLIK